MNYEQARHIGSEGPAPGAWNWTTARDGAIWTSHPCAWPDSPIPADWQPGQELVRTGRERCDHATREEAERHHWDAEIADAPLVAVDVDRADAQYRCRYPECRAWATHAIHWDGFAWDDVCPEHTGEDARRVIRPFTLGLRVVHS